MRSLKAILKTKTVVLSDGAWGSNLQNLGLQLGECPEEWNISNPGKVREVAENFIKAGAELVKTNSFGGNWFKLSQYELQDKVPEIDEKAAQLSREAAGDSVLVLGSIGPTGKMLITGEVSKEDLYTAFKDQAIALEKGGADVILVETMSDLEEARQAVKAAKENTKCEIACTMTFEKTVDNEYKTMMGLEVSEMVTPLKEAGADFIGSNCGNGIENMIDIVRKIREKDKDVPVIIHANAGMPVYEEGKAIYPETPEEMASRISTLIEAGANVIGGCCGTTSDHIKAMKQAIQKALSK